VAVGSNRLDWLRVVVLVLKPYSYDDWLRIATQNNVVRTSKYLTPWRVDDIFALWRQCCA
jgi:hypothetical protein